MKRMIVFNYTGAEATNLAIAKRLARKIRGAQRNGECVLVDCDECEISLDFLNVLLKGAKPDKTKFCGLAIMLQVELALRIPDEGVCS